MKDKKANCILRSAGVNKNGAGLKVLEESKLKTNRNIAEV